MAINLFKIVEDGSKYDVVIDNAQVLLFKEFRDLMKARMNNKDRITAEFAYIYWACDYRSPAIQNSYSEKDILITARENLKIDVSWTPDKWVEACCNRYRKEQDTTAMRLYKTCIRTFNDADKVVQKLNDKIMEMISTDLNAEEGIKLINLFEKTLTLVGTMPDNLAKLQKAEELALKDLKGDKAIRGNDELLDSMLPGK